MSKFWFWGFIVAVFIVSCSFASADWGMSNKDSANTRWDGFNVTPLQGGSCYTGWADSMGNSLVVDGGFLYYSKVNDPQDGFAHAHYWVYKVNASSVSSDVQYYRSGGLSSTVTAGLAVSDDFVFACLDSGIFKFSVNNLSVVLYNNSNSCLSNILVVGDYVYTVRNSVLYQSSSSNLSIVAQRGANSPVGMQCRFPAVVGGFAYFGCNLSFYKSSASDINSDVASVFLNKSVGAPIVSGGHVYVAGSNGVGFYQLSASDLSVEHILNWSFSSNFAVADGFVFLSSGGRTYKLDASDLSVVVNSSNSCAGSPSIVVNNGFVYCNNLLLSESSLALVSSLDVDCRPNTGSFLNNIAVSNAYVYYGHSMYFSLQVRPFDNLGTSYVANLTFFPPTPNTGSGFYEPFFSVNVTAVNQSATQLHNLTIIFYNASGVRLNSAYFESDVPVLDAFATFNAPYLGTFFYNVTVCLTDGLCVNSLTRSVTLYSIINFVSPTPDSGALIYNTTFTIHAVASNFSDIQLRNLTISLFNSTDHLLPDATQIVSGNGSPIIDLTVVYSNLSFGNYSFSAVAFDVLNRSFSSLTRSVELLSSCTEVWYSQLSVCIAGNQTLFYSDSHSCGTYANLPVNNGSIFSCSCIEDWSQHFGDCINNQKLVFYTDNNLCGSTFDLPVDDNTFVSCAPCVESWSASFIPASCTSGVMTKLYTDSNHCNVSANLPFDNGSVSSCNIFSSISTSITVHKFDIFSVDVGAVFGSNPFVSVFYPNGSIVNLSVVWNGFVYESPFILADVNGSYVVSAFAGNQSISSSFVVSDVEVVIPVQFNGVVVAGGNFSFLMEVFTDALFNLTHNISCDVPSGFSCIVPSGVDVVSYGNFSVIVTSNDSLSNGSYVGFLNVTRLADGRVFSTVLNLGISSLFGIPMVDNPSPLLQVVSSSDVVSTSYIVRNVGNFSLSNCSVSVDGSFAGLGFVSGSQNFSLGLNDSLTVNVSYVHPPVGVYNGYFNVFCIASAEGLVSGLVNPVLQQLIVVAPSVSAPAGGGAPSTPIVSYSNVSAFLLLNRDGSANGYVSYSYPSGSLVKTFVVQSKVADSLPLSVSCRGDFCSYVKFSKSSFSLAGFGNDFFTATVSIPKSVALNGVYSYEVVLSDGVRSSSLINEVHISGLSQWYSKFSPFVREGDKGFWFSLGGFNVPKLLLYLLLVLSIDLLTVAILPKDKFYRQNLVLILTVVSLIVFGLSALIY